MDTSKFIIKKTDGNRSGSIPPHFDIIPEGQTDSIITVWTSLEMAQECVRFLESSESSKVRGI